MPRYVGVKCLNLDLTGLNLPCDAHVAGPMASCLNPFPERLCVVTSGLRIGVFSWSSLLAVSPTVCLCPDRGVVCGYAAPQQAVSAMY